MIPGRRAQRALPSKASQAQVFTHDVQCHSRTASRRSLIAPSHVSADCRHRQHGTWRNSCGLHDLHTRPDSCTIRVTPRYSARRWAEPCSRRSNATLAEGQGSHTTNIPPPDIAIPPSIPAAPRPSIRDRLRKLKLERERVQQAAAQDAQGDPENTNAAEAQALAEEEDIDEEDISAYMGEYDRLLEDYDAQDSTKFALRPGDLIEISGSGSTSSRLAVYLRTINQKAQYFTINGLISIATYQNALMIVPEFVSQESLEPILKYFPADYMRDAGQLLHCYRENVPRHMGAPITNKLAEFHAASEEAYRAYASKLDNAHRILAHPTQYTHTSLDNVASRLTGIAVADLPSPLLLAVSNCLIRSEFGFKIENRTFAYTRILGVESKQTTAAVRRVVRWVRAYQKHSILGVGTTSAPEEVANDAGVLRSFVSKAKKLIERSRELRIYSPEGMVLMNKISDDKGDLLGSDPVGFSSSDQDFIKFLMLLVSTKSYFFHPTLRSMPTAILRATGLYPDVDLDADKIHAFLVEIGVLQPWQDANPFDREISFPDPAIDVQIEDIRKRIEQGEDPHAAAGISDSMQDMRKDWGEMPVFCIDSADAIDLDDGISLEEVSGDPNQYWLHIHVVHLSAFTSPDHILAKLAEKQLQSSYLAEGRVPMFPPWVSPQFSLTRDAPVMTISTRLDKQGKQYEYKIQAGVVRNVVKINLESTDAIFGHQAKDFMRLTVAAGGEDARKGLPRHDASFAHVSEDHQETLNKLHDLTRNLEDNRKIRSPVSDAMYGKFRITGLEPQTASVSMDKLPTQASFSTIEPSIAYYTNLDYDRASLDPDGRSAPSRNIVEESMLQAGAAAAEWAAQRKLPIPYWGTGQNIGGLDIEGPVMRAKIKDMALGRLPFERGIINYFRKQFMSSTIRTDPVPHRPLGFKYYTKITSPLRRYLDLVSQWQVDAALREEARLGTSLASSVVEEANVRAEAIEAQEALESAEAVKAIDVIEGIEADSAPQSEPATTNDSGDPHEASTSSALEDTAEVLPTDDLAITAPSNDTHPAQHLMTEPTIAPTTRPIPTFTSPPFLPFTASQITAHISRWRWRTYQSRRFEVSHLKHWKTLAVARAFYLKEYPLPSPLTVVLGISGGARRLCRIQGLDITCDTEERFGADGNRVQEGDRWEAVIKSVKIHSKRIVVGLTRRLRSAVEEERSHRYVVTAPPGQEKTAKEMGSEMPVVPTMRKVPESYQPGHGEGSETTKPMFRNKQFGSAAQVRSPRGFTRAEKMHKQMKAEKLIRKGRVQPRKLEADDTARSVVPEAKSEAKVDGDAQAKSVE